jgi:murein DD-endopeptidase MepM/ murein hydrolase activator NlpD
VLLLALTGCVRNQAEVIVITATFQSVPINIDNNIPLPPGPTPFVTVAPPLSPPTPAPVPAQTGGEIGGGQQVYTVQPGDTLFGIAEASGVSLETLMSYNENLENPDVLTVGQVINVPEAPSSVSQNFVILPDSRFVNAPGSSSFDVFAFVDEQPGYIRTATDEVDGEFFSAAQVVRRVSQEFGVDARLLLALLEFRGGWLTNPEPPEDVQIYPMGENDPDFGYDRRGLYRQLTWAADQLNRGYYGWKYRDLTTVELTDGARLLYDQNLNAGTVGIQYFLSLLNAYPAWAWEVSPSGFAQTYVFYFGDPFADEIDPLIPADLEQPQLMLPFAPGQTWFYTGGPHGGWGSGSAWSAVDFAPPDELPEDGSTCYISDYFATAVASGIIVRSANGIVMLDLDGDGDETTGWTILYLHISERDRVANGTVVQPGDPIGRPSCEGGFSNGTHIHLARRYNGEWLPVDCDDCPTFVMNNWTMVGYVGQEYQGVMVNNDEQRVAEQGRLTTENRISH